MANEKRYNSMKYERCGRSGIRLPRISLGLWHNFGGVDSESTAREMLLRSFDLGITHFDLANNYGPPPGSAEITFGKIMKRDLAPFRDEMIISTKAGYLMWPGPYGEWGSRKYLLASLDQSLKRMELDYVDIFYSHRFDPETPLEETMGALAQAVRSGKALYAGISNYDPEQTQNAIRILRDAGIPLLIHQPKYSIFERRPEQGLLELLGREGVGCIVFSPLAQGMLTDRYLKGIPPDSRAAKPHGFLRPEALTKDQLARIEALNGIAKQRGESLTQMALKWVLRQRSVTSAVIGASRVSQIEECVGSLEGRPLTAEDLDEIERIIA